LSQPARKVISEFSANLSQYPSFLASPAFENFAFQSIDAQTPKNLVLRCGAPVGICRLCGAKG
jgi:hypothetical protein